MSLSKAFTTENTAVTVNGRLITDFGTAEQPITEEFINPKRTLVQGVGGNAVVLERKKHGLRLTLSLMAGSPDSAFMHGLYMTGGTVTYGRMQVGSADLVGATEGVVVNESAITRGGASSISDDVYVIEFNSCTSMRGGE